MKYDINNFPTRIYTMCVKRRSSVMWLLDLSRAENDTTSQYQSSRPHFLNLYKWDWSRNQPLNNKTPQFCLNQADILAILNLPTTHELVIFTQLYNDWMKIADFLLIINFWTSRFFSSCKSLCQNKFKQILKSIQFSKDVGYM